ncbi:hypothetical protein [Chryseobacterium hispalense]|uniref:hypothetical protein n=1 Tax=Chryseobacterium hispalense TaxID=1453492 RepID=UPI00391C4B8D
MKKIYYYPGLISAVIVPVLFWVYINPYVDKTKYNVIDIGIPAKLREDRSNDIYSFESVRNWDYKKIKVDPSKAKQNSNFYVSEIKALQKRNEKDTGIEFILDHNNTYGDFVSLLNDMAIAKQETYAVDLEKTGHIFAVQGYKDPYKIDENYYGIRCGTRSDSDTVYYMDELNYRGLEKMNYLFNLPKQSYYILFGFLLFLNISMLSIKERFQIQRLRLL